MKPTLLLKSLLLVLLVLTACGKKSDELPEAQLRMSDEITRALNRNSYTVFDAYGTYYVEDGDLFVKGSKIDVEIKPLLSSSLSKIGTWLYYLGKDGLVRYDTVSSKLEKVYFDDIDQVAVGLNTIYYIVNKGVYAYNGETYSTQPNEWDGRYFYVRNNYFLYSTENGAARVDLITNEVTLYRGVLTEVEVTDFGFILKMDKENVSVR